MSEAIKAGLEMIKINYIFIYKVRTLFYISFMSWCLFIKYFKWMHIISVPYPLKIINVSFWCFFILELNRISL